MYISFPYVSTFYNIYYYYCVFSACVFQKVLHIGGLTLIHSRSIHHSPVWRSPLIPIVVEQTVSEMTLSAGLCSKLPCVNAALCMTLTQSRSCSGLLMINSWWEMNIHPQLKRRLTCFLKQPTMSSNLNRLLHDAGLK